jgi:hypothetical protein
MDFDGVGQGIFASRIKKAINAVSAIFHQFSKKTNFSKKGIKSKYSKNKLK